MGFVRVLFGCGCGYWGGGDDLGNGVDCGVGARRRQEEYGLVMNERGGGGGHAAC